MLFKKLQLWFLGEQLILSLLELLLFVTLKNLKSGLLGVVHVFLLLLGVNSSLGDFGELGPIVFSNISCLKFLSIRIRVNQSWDFLFGGE